MIDLLTSTGIRVGELVKLNRSDLDFENRECIVFGKGNKQRKVYFDARTKIHLQRYLSERTDGNESLFVSLLKPYERLQISGVEIRLRKIGRELNFNKVHPHKFRRTLATMAIDKGNLYPWNYYYVKYPVFRPGSYGKMSNDDVVNKPYMFSVMQTKTQWSQNTYMPYLKEADDDHLSRDEMGQYLVYDDVYIVCENNSYGVYRNDDDSLTDTVTISQNEAGIDTEDRIIKLKKYIANMK